MGLVSAVCPTQWRGIQRKKAHLLQGLQTLLSVRKNRGLHLQIVSLFFEPIEKRRNCCHNLDREENKRRKIHSKMGGRLSRFAPATEEEKKDSVYI